MTEVNLLGLSAQASTSPCAVEYLNAMSNSLRSPAYDNFPNLPNCSTGNFRGPISKTLLLSERQVLRNGAYRQVGISVFPHSEKPNYRGFARVLSFMPNTKAA